MTYVVSDLLIGRRIPQIVVFRNIYNLDILLNFHELDAGGINRVAEEDDAALLEGSLDPLKVARAGGGDAGGCFETLNGAMI